jgi:hypothetical protein
MKQTLILPIAIALTAISIVPLTEPHIHNDKAQTQWTKENSKAYAMDKLSEWQDKQWKCLVSLWGKESAWNPAAYNKIKVMGKHAGGIPQLLGLDPATPATKQIDRGLSYIYYRYGTPCSAWAHFKKKGWH